MKKPDSVSEKGLAIIMRLEGTGGREIQNKLGISRTK